MTYTTTTSYGTWNNHGDSGNTTVEATIADAINGGDADWRERMDTSGALDRIADDYRDAINNALPDGVSLAGDDFYGPYSPADDEFDGCLLDEDGHLDIAGIVASVDLYAIIEQHDVDTADDSTEAGDAADITVTAADVESLLASGAEEPVLYVKLDEDTGKPVGIDVWAGALIPSGTLIVRRCDLLDAIGDDPDADVILGYLPVLQQYADDVFAALA